jgi:uncharacterized membrane protein YkoI
MIGMPVHALRNVRQEGELMSQMKAVWVLAVSIALGTAVTAPVSAESSSKGKSATKAKITMKEARALALAKVPKGKVEEEELEREHGKLVYSFDIRVPGKSGIEEVQIDAMNGKVVSIEHETPQAERKEAQEEKQEAQKGKGAPTKTTP